MLNTLPALPAPATPPGQPTPPAPQANAGAGAGAGAKSQARPFARELERARPQPDPPAPQASVNGQAHAGARPAAKAAQGSTPATHPAQSTAAATAARGRAELPPEQRSGVDDPAADPNDNGTGESRASDAVAAADWSSLLAGLMAPAPTTATAPAVPPRGAADATAAAEARVFVARHGASAQEADDPSRAAPVGAAVAPGPNAAEDPVGTAALQAVQELTGEQTAENAVEHAAKSTPAADSRHAEAAIFSLPQPVATAPSSLARFDAAVATGAPAPYAAQIAAPVGSPEFAPGLSAQLSVMVRDGLQEARLQLNPAEMGPITVQIQIDGRTAQVTLVAEQAPTRQALEQAMPTLASALREGGLTLTGGGVFEQAPPNTQQEQQQRQAQAQRDAAASHRGGNRPGSEGGDALARPAIGAAGASTRRGVLDLYA